PNATTHLGGENIDMLLMDRVLADVSTPDAASGSSRSSDVESGFSRTSDVVSGFSRTPGMMQQLRKTVIQAKWDLSSQEATDIRLEGYNRTITRVEFEALIQPIVDRTLGPCRQALADAGLQPSQIDEVVLVGGS